MSSARLATLPAPRPALVEALRGANIPLEDYADACRACEACDDDEEVERYPKGFDQDTSTPMLGELKAYGRQILISTGKSDWAHDICEDKTQLPALVQSAYEEEEKKSAGGKGGIFGKLGSKILGGGAGGAKSKDLPGVHPSSAAPTGEGEVSSRLSILSSSFLTSSHSPAHQSAIILPDYKVVHDLSASPSSAEELVRRYLSPSLGRAGGPEEGMLKSHPLPYHCVVLLCSHRKRDKRCSISAPLLINQFHHHLAHHGFHVDERGDDLADAEAIEEWEGTVDEKEQRLKETLQGVTKEDGARVGLFKVSHLGGHKFAGNIIIYFPSGSVIWYGRALPSDVRLIVERTILEGKVIPEFLRGGLGLVGKDREGGKGVLEW
ncbi:hypothetical protein JCM11641_005273 [Rhodosporidiobolus odoratus]